jgi:hypothetical protein
VRRPPRAVATSRRGMSKTVTDSAAAPTNRRVPTNLSMKHRRQRRVHVAQSHGPDHLAWYAGLTVMALFEVIEWPLAIVIAVGHEIARRSRNKALRELAEGIEAGG